jgi:hypothetical protein
MKRACAVSALFAVGISATAAQPRDRLIGLLALRQLEGPWCEPPPPVEVPLYATPASADPIGWIRAGKHPESGSDCYIVILNVHRRDGSVRELPTKEYEEEEPDAAIVFEQRDRWFKVRLEDGTAWLQASDRDQYFSLQKLFTRRPAHLTDAWDGKVADVPEGPGKRPPADPRRRVIGYVTPSLESSAWVQAFERPDQRTAVADAFQITATSVGWSLRSLRRNPPQVPVFARNPGWLQVALEGNNWREDRRVWIEDAAFWRFHGFRSDTEQEKFEDDALGREHSLVEFLDSQYVRAALWLHIQVMSHTIYESAEPPRVVATGWVPAHDSAGELVVWAFSRD